MLIFAVILGIYNFLFAVYSKKAKDGSVIALPSTLTNLLIVSVSVHSYYNFFAITYIKNHFMKKVFKS